jgi:lipopolysaccharide transport system ATP-binding protein
MPNWLNEGEYHLVVALEERSGAGIVYFDFVEGAAWLRTRTPQRHWGLFLPPVQVEMRADDAQPGSVAA